MWSETNDVDAELYRGSRLEAVLEALPERAHELNEDEMAFVDASRLARDAERERERRTNRRLRRLLTAAACLVVVAVLAGLLAYNRQVAANHSRRSAEITTLANRSEAMRSSNRDAAALLAIEANRLRPDDESRAALFSTFTRDPGFLGYHFLGGADGARVQGALVPDSNTAIVSIGFANPETPDTSLRAVDLTTGEEGPPFEAIDAHDYVINAAVSTDGRVAVAYGKQVFNGSNPREALGFDIATGRAIGPRIILSDNKDQRNDEFSVAVNRDGTQIAVGGGTFGQVRIFDIRSGDLLTTIDAPDDMLSSIQGRETSSANWAPDGTLYVGSSGTHLRQFDPESFELMRDITVPEIATGGTLQFSPDGAFVVARGNIFTDVSSGSLARIDLADGRTAWTIGPEEYASSSCDALAFSLPEDRLWCADYSGVIRGRSLSTGALDGTTVEHQRSGLTSMAVQSVAGQRYLVSFGMQSPSIGRWQIDGGGPLTRHLADGYDGVDYSPSGRWLLGARGTEEPNSLIGAVWDTVDQHQVLTLPPEIADVAWLDDERLVVVDADGHTRVIDVSTGGTSDGAVDVQPGWTRPARAGDGRLAFGYADGHVDVYDFDEGTRVVTLRPSAAAPIKDRGSVFLMAASADGTRLYVQTNPGQGLGLYEFDINSGEQLAMYPDTGIASFAAAGDGPVAFGHINGTVTLHDPRDLSLVGTLPGTRSFAWVTYDGSGRFLSVQGNDGTMALYDVVRRQRMGDPIDIGGDASVAVRPDGLELAVATIANATVTLWSLDAGTMSDTACRIAGRNLTHAEWNTYIGNLAPYHATCPDYPVPEA